MSYTNETGLTYLLGKLKNYFAPKSSLSHVGMIVHTTTLDTMAKVIAVYGGTTWIQHSGYMLRGAGANDSVLNNSASSDGSVETVTLTGAQSGLAAHGHGFTNPRIQAQILYEKTAASGSARNHIATGGDWSSMNTFINAIATGGAVQDADAADAAEAHENMPPYKNVYIWERTA